MHKFSAIYLWAITWPILLLCTAGAALGETYKVGLRTAKDGEHGYTYSAVFPRVLEAIGDISGDHFEYIQLPPSRVKKYFNEGKIDIEPGTNPVWRAKETVPGLYSVVFSRNDSILLFRHGQRQPYENSSNATVLTVGTVRGFSYPTLEGKFKQGLLKRFDEVHEIRLIQAILDGRLDQVVVSHHLAKTWLSNNANHRLYEFGQVLERQPLMMRLHPNAETLLPRLNQAIKTLINTGKMTQLTGIVLKP